MCLRLGVLHPDVLLDQLTAAQWEEWLAYYSLSPWDELRRDIAAAYTTAAIHNRHLGKHEQPHKLQEFLPFDVKPEVTIEQKLMRAFGGPGRADRP